MSDSFFKESGKRTVEVTAFRVFAWNGFTFAIHRPLSTVTGRACRSGWHISNVESGQLASRLCDTIKEAVEWWETTTTGQFFNPKHLLGQIEKSVANNGLINDPKNLPDAPPRDWKKTAEEATELLRNLVSAVADKSDKDAYGMAYLEAKAFIDEN